MPGSGRRPARAEGAPGPRLPGPALCRLRPARRRPPVAASRAVGGHLRPDRQVREEGAEGRETPARNPGPWARGSGEGTEDCGRRRPLRYRRTRLASPRGSLQDNCDRVVTSEDFRGLSAWLRPVRARDTRVAQQAPARCARTPPPAGTLLLLPPQPDRLPPPLPPLRSPPAKATCCGVGTLFTPIVKMPE